NSCASKWGTIVEKTLEGPYCPAPSTLRNTPLVLRLQSDTVPTPGVCGIRRACSGFGSGDGSAGASVGHGATSLARGGQNAPGSHVQGGVVQGSEFCPVIAP